MGRVRRRRRDANRACDTQPPARHTGKLLEALAGGAQVPASDTPGMAPIGLDDPDGPLGETCDLTDPAIIGEAIRRIVDLDPAACADLRRRLAQRHARALELGDRGREARRALRGPDQVITVLAMPGARWTAVELRARSSTRAQLPGACRDQFVSLGVTGGAAKTRRADRPELVTRPFPDASGTDNPPDVEGQQDGVSSMRRHEIDAVDDNHADAPAVSVIIPCYRQARYLHEVVASVVAQTFTDWEIVIVDDGSPDDTAHVAQGLIETYPHHRIRLLRQENLGSSGARNSGINFSIGRYILPLDADDMIKPQMLEWTVALLEADHSVEIAYTDRKDFGAINRVVRLKEYKPERLARANIFQVSALYRRSVWAVVGGYNPNMKLGFEDWDFWVGAAEAGFRARRVPEPLFLYRVTENSRTSRAYVHGPSLIAQIRANHPAFFALHLSDADMHRIDRLARANLDYAAGRSALREGRRSDARALLRQALRKGSGGIRAKALVGLGCTYLGFDFERIAGTRRWIRSRRGHR